MRSWSYTFYESKTFTHLNIVVYYRVAILLKQEPQLLENIGKVTRVLELLSDKEFTNRRGDVNEILSLKYHVLHYILKVICTAVL